MSSTSVGKTQEVQRHDDTEERESLTTRSRCDDSKSINTSRTHTRSSRHSHRSSASNEAVRARAKAEAARVAVSYAEKEANVMKEKARLAAESAFKEADLEAQLHVLKREKVAAAATAEAEVLEAAEELEENESRSYKTAAIPVPTSNPAQRTSEYVQKHSHSIDSEKCT